ncbi:hypothetical protein HDU76_010890 [Blyttiomyces sp. JEL0837]|nr:hypothetical protein HDU76_010890 [Blyttiomyces sp. JEL0837]
MTSTISMYRSSKAITYKEYCKMKSGEVPNDRDEYVQTGERDNEEGINDEQVFVSMQNLLDRLFRRNNDGKRQKAKELLEKSLSLLKRTSD